MATTSARVNNSTSGPASFHLMSFASVLVSEPVRLSFAITSTISWVATGYTRHLSLDRSD